MQNILYYYSHHHFDTGSPKALVGIIELIDRSKYKPYFLATGYGPLIKELSERNVKILTAQVNRIRFLNILKTLYNAIVLLILLKKHNIKLIHINEYGINYDLVLAAKLCGIPITLHIHNPEDLRICNFHTFLADNVFLVSNAVSEAVIGYEKIKNKSTLLYNYVNVSNIQKGYNIRVNLGFSKEDILVGVIGQITPEKGTDLLIKVAENLIKIYPNLHFIFAGRTGENQERFLKKTIKYINKKKLNKNIHILGIRNDIPNILASINLFCLATKAETFCIALVEAMAAGLPIIASAVGAIPELMSNNGILIYEHNIKKFCKQIAWLIDNPKIAKKFGKKAKESIKGRLDKNICFTQLHSTYDLLIKKT